MGNPDAQIYLWGSIHFIPRMAQNSVMHLQVSLHVNQCTAERKSVVLKSRVFSLTDSDVR